MLSLLFFQLDESRQPVGITLHLHSAPDASSLEPINLELGVTTNEDLLCDLGSPIRSFWKEDVSKRNHARARLPRGGNR